MTKSSKFKGFGAKESYPKIEGIGQLVSPIKYVIFQPAKDDYFQTEEEDQLLVRIGWCPTPSRAKKFLTLLRAEAKAKEIISSKGYALQICELYETNKQFLTSVVAEFRGSLH